MAFEYAMIENQINTVMGIVECYPFLAAFKTKSGAEFNQELL